MDNEDANWHGTTEPREDRIQPTEQEEARPGEDEESPEQARVVRDGAAWLKAAADIHLFYGKNFSKRLSKEAVKRMKIEGNTIVDTKHVQAGYQQLVTDRPKKEKVRTGSSVLAGVFLTALIGQLLSLNSLDVQPESSTIVWLFIFLICFAISLGVSVWAHTR